MRIPCQIAKEDLSPDFTMALLHEAELGLYRSRALESEELCFLRVHAINSDSVFDQGLLYSTP